MKTYFFFISIIVYSMAISCTSIEKKNKGIVLIFNSPEDLSYTYSARVLILTDRVLEDTKCNSLNINSFFGLSSRNRVGFIKSNLDTTWLNCTGLGDIGEINNRYVKSSSFKPLFTNNNFWIAKNFNYKSLNQIDSIVKEILKCTDEIIYFDSNGTTNSISLNSKELEYYYFFDAIEVKKGDSLFYIEMTPLSNIGNGQGG